MKKRKLVLSKETIRPLDAHALSAVAGGSYGGNYCQPPTTTRIGQNSMPAMCGIFFSNGCFQGPSGPGEL